MNDYRAKLKTIGRIFIFLVTYLILSGGLQYGGSLLMEIDLINANLSSIDQLTMRTIDLISTFSLVWLFMKFVNKEQLIEVGLQVENRSKDFVVGVSIGLLIFVVAYLVLIVSDEIFYKGLNFDIKELVISILVFSIVSLVEEVLCRGYILKNLMGSFNKYLALIMTSLLFSLMHFFNPNVDLFSLFNIFLAGILLGISYLYTKNLWFPIGLHLGWNLFQSLFGFKVSGQSLYSIIEFEIHESTLLNGGEFGFEGSYLSIVAELIVITGIVIFYERDRKSVA